MRHRQGSSRHCSSAHKMFQEVLLGFLALSPSPSLVPSAAARQFAGSPVGPQLPIIPPDPLKQAPTGQPEGDHEFTLRHIFHHGTVLYPEMHRRRDVSADEPAWLFSDGVRYETPTRLKAHSRPQNIQRLADNRPSTVNPLLTASWREGIRASWENMAWTVDEVPSPDHTDKETVLTFARAAANAYVEEPGTGEWEDVNGGYNYSQSFGWQEDGLRGHIFVDATNSTIIMGLKGTSMAVFDGSGTTTNDKENDNLLGSCCCGQGGRYFWRQVCDCSTGTFSCNQTCLVKELEAENRYYKAAKDLYGNVTSLYPDANVWLSGHSLGGVLTSLLGLTYGVPVITFEAYGDALAAGRLGLPSPPGSDPSAHQTRELTGAYHFGHTADPVFMGTCNAATSACSIAGYSFESVCHTGHECVYDVVEDKGWRVSIGMHRIHPVIDQVIEAYDELPECKRDKDCYDCYNWKFYHSNGSEPSTTSTSSSTSRTRTRTSTCKTPGWFGCLDPTSTTTRTVTSPTTTSAALTTSTTTTATTTTCSSYGWFGNCLDPSTTTTTIVTSTTSDSREAARPAPTTTPKPTSPPASSSPPTTSTSSSTPAPTSPSGKCLRRRFWLVGRCLEWGDGDSPSHEEA